MPFHMMKLLDILGKKIAWVKLRYPFEVQERASCLTFWFLSVVLLYLPMHIPSQCRELVFGM